MGSHDPLGEIIKDERFTHQQRLALSWLLHNAKKAKTSDLKKDQLFFDIRSAAKAWGISKSTVARWMDLFEKQGVISWERGSGELCQNCHNGDKGVFTEKSKTSKSGTRNVGHGNSVVTMLNDTTKKSNPPKSGTRENGTRAAVPTPRKNKTTKGVDSVEVVGHGDQPRTTHKKKTLIDDFFDEHLLVFGEKYVVSGARDGQIMHKLLEVHDKKKIRACIKLFFKDQDPWMKTAGYTIPVFKARINRYVQQLTNAPARQRTLDDLKYKRADLERQSRILLQEIEILEEKGEAVPNCEAILADKRVEVERINKELEGIGG